MSAGTISISYGVRGERTLPKAGSGALRIPVPDVTQFVYLDNPRGALAMIWAAGQVAEHLDLHTEDVVVHDVHILTRRPALGAGS